VHFLILGLETESLHGDAKFVLIDGSRSVGVEKIEGFLDLLLLVIGQLLLTLGRPVFRRLKLTLFS
jgi:hypothetical protein